MSFGKRTAEHEPVRHRKPPVSPKPAADEALHHAKLAGAAALQAIPEVRIPWRKIQRWTINLMVTAAVVGGLGWLGNRHIKAEAMSSGLAEQVASLQKSCRQVNDLSPFETPADCAKLFGIQVAERMAYAYYWLHMAGVDAIPEERRAFEAAKARVTAGLRRHAARATTDSAVPTANAPSRPYEPSFDIDAKCRTKWPNNYSMEEYCIKQQVEARSWAKGRTIEGRIATHCAGKWESDWSMFQYCVKQEEQARDRIGR